MKIYKRFFNLCENELDEKLISKSDSILKKKKNDQWIKRIIDDFKYTKHQNTYKIVFNLKLAMDCVCYSYIITC